MPGWEIVVDAPEAHALLVASDAHAARTAAHGQQEPPLRNPDTTARLVSRGDVHGLRRDGRLLAAVVLNDEPTFVPVPECADVAPVLYMRRLCVDPGAGDALLGYRAVRHAVAHAGAHGYRAVRSEVNPDITSVVRMLESLGFRQRGEVDRTSAAPVAQMECVLDGS